MAQAQITIAGVSHCYRPPSDTSSSASTGRPQVDAALPHRRLSPHGNRQDPHRGQADRRAGSGPRHRLSAFRTVSVEDSARQCPLRLGAHGAPARRTPAAGAILHRSGRADRLRGQLSFAAFRRHAPAHRARPHARLRPENPADGRAVRRARRPDPRPHAVRAAQHLAAHAEDRDLRDSRRAGGGLSRRPRGGDVRAPRPHQGDRRYQVRQERSCDLQEQGLHRQGRRDLEPGAHRSDQSADRAGVMIEPATTTASRGTERRMKAALLRYLPLLLLALAWEVGARTGLVSTLALPALSTVVTAWIDLLKDGELVSNGAASLWRSGAGLTLAIVVGAVLGIFMAWWRPVNVLLSPLVEVFYPMPKSALIPVTVLWLGFGNGSKILLIFLGCMLPVTVGAFNGARSSEQALVWSARSMGANRLRMLWDVVVPSALPELLNGIRTALALSFILLVSSELIAAREGLGHLIGFLGASGTYDAMFAVVLTVALLGFIADRIYLVLMQRMLRWRE